MINSLFKAIQNVGLQIICLDLFLQYQTLHKRNLNCFSIIKLTLINVARAILCYGGETIFSSAFGSSVGSQN